MSNNISRSQLKKAIELATNESIRVCQHNLSSDLMFWDLKYDTSCGVLGSDGPSGIEMASRICCGIKDLRKIMQVGKVLSNAGSSVNDNCGLHVHVDVSDFNESEIGSMILYWMLVESVLVYAMPSRRLNSKYCKMLLGTYDQLILSTMHKMGNYDKIAALFYPEDGILNINDAKRRTLNINNFYFANQNCIKHRNTVEFRWPEGSLDSKDIMAWVMIFVSFVDFVKSNSSFPSTLFSKRISLEQTLCLLGIGHGNKFRIFDSSVLYVRKWILQRIIDNEIIPTIEHILVQNDIKKNAKTLLDKYNIYRG